MNSAVVVWFVVDVRRTNGTADVMPQLRPMNARLFGSDSARQMALLGADDQGLSGCGDEVGADVVEAVDVHQPADLGHQPFDESEVASGSADYWVARSSTAGSGSPTSTSHSTPKTSHQYTRITGSNSAYPTRTSIPTVKPSF